MNPYLSRVMLAHPGQFFGRNRELRHLFSRVGAVHPQCVSIVGERRIGKSSLLNALTWDEMQVRYLGERLSPVIAMLDLQRHPNLRPDRFFTLILEEIYRRHSQSGIQGNGTAYENFLQLLEQLRATSRGLVLLLDEFDTVTANPSFNAEFYACLRAAANGFPVAYVTSSRVELGRMCHSSDIADSPFFNIFSNLYLRVFQPEEALALIREPSEREGVPLSPYASQVVSLAGHFPFYLQIACSLYFDALLENPKGEPDHGEIRERFLEEAGPHFDYYCEHADPAVRRLLTALPNAIDIDPEYEHVARRLFREGYLTEEEGRIRPFSEAFAEHLRRRKSLQSGNGKRMDVTRLDEPEGLDSQTIHQYRVLEKAGEGGMGVVYAAEDTLLRRRVALKICRPELLGNETMRKRIFREAQLAASLSHPAIVAVHELFEHGGQIVLVMEWVDGRNLESIIRDRGALPWRDATALVQQAADGLDAAHSRGVIHRDVKSSNLMVDEQGKVRLTDFGLAKGREHPASSLTITGAMVGTLAYMSPEQVLGDEVDYRSDLFSLGTVLFEALTGRLPFRRSTLQETLNAIVQEEAPSPVDLGIDCPAGLTSVLGRLLEKRPEDRYASAADLEGELKLLLENSGRRRFPWFFR